MSALFAVLEVVTLTLRRPAARFSTLPEVVCLGLVGHRARYKRAWGRCGATIGTEKLESGACARALRPNTVGTRRRVHLPALRPANCYRTGCCAARMGRARHHSGRGGKAALQMVQETGHERCADAVMGQRGFSVDVRTRNVACGDTPDEAGRHGGLSPLS
jgi:hypothetical protein